MNARTLGWSATLMALAMTVSVPAQAQESTGDPFLDAMLSDQQAAAEEEAKTAEPEPSAPAVTEEAETAQPAVEAHLTRPTDDLVGVMSAEVMEREFGDNTAVFANDHVYDGKTVKAVRIRYISGKAVLPDQRLLDVIQTGPGTKYSSVRVNEDLERLIKNGFIDGDARVAVEPTSGGVRVIFEVRPTSVMAGVGFTGNTRFDDD